MSQNSPTIKRASLPEIGPPPPVVVMGEDAVPVRRVRHYQRIEQLVPRTSEDVAPGFADAQASLRMFGAADAALPVKPRLVSTAHGAITRLLFTIPRYAVDDEARNPLARAYRDLFAKLSPSIELTILTHDSSQPTVSEWLTNAGRAERSTVVTVADHLHFSIWAEDGYVVAKDQAARTFFIEPFSFPRYGDSLIADLIGTATDLETSQAPLYFQGGNVLIGDDFFLIGVDYPTNSLEYVNSVIVPNAGETGIQLIRRLYGTYLDTSRELHYVGSSIPVPSETTRRITVNGEPYTEILYFGNRRGTAQPLFHIDMFVTLAGRNSTGKYQLLVGDPKMAADTLNVALRPHAMREVFDNIASGLTQVGFEVIRNPLPLVYFDDEQRRERVWYFATSNNALVQIPDQGPKIVWLPSYGHGAWAELTATDARNKQIWESLGFEVRMLEDFHPFAENLGAVHCIKKYLARS